MPDDKAPTAKPGAEPVGAEPNLDLLMDVSVMLSVEMGRTRMTIAEILKLTPGSVVGLQKSSNEPLELRVNGKLIAYGEVVVVGENYGIRISDIVDPAKRKMAANTATS